MTYMTYSEYLRLYRLSDSANSRENWLYSEWSKGNLILYDGHFYSVETGEEVK